MRELLCEEQVLDRKTMDSLKFLYRQAPVSLIQELNMKVRDCVIDISSNPTVRLEQNDTSTK